MAIYLDHNATSPLRPEARAAWLEVVDHAPGNPSSLHASGRWARDRIDLARERVAGALGVDEDELVFNSGATEGNNTALLGALEAAGDGATLVVGRAEHASVLAVADVWSDRGGAVERYAVRPDGLPDLEDLVRRTPRDRPAVVTAFAANNETGAAPDLAAVRAALTDAIVPRTLHVDAVQALGKLDLHAILPHADQATFSAHKVGGPTGVGVLWRRKGVAGRPLVVGGGQEGGARAGTENAAGVVAASVAVELAVRERAEAAPRLRALTDEMANALVHALRGARVLGPNDPERRLPNTLSLLVPGHDGKVLVTRLDLEGLEVGAGSACSSGALGASHVLTAMGLADDEARAALRVSLGRNTTREECKSAVTILCKVLAPSNAT